MAKLQGILIFLGAAVFAYSAAPAAAIKTGPAVGATIPKFKAVDQNGASYSSKSILGAKGAILVFFRSADW